MKFIPPTEQEDMCIKMRVKLHILEDLYDNLDHCKSEIFHELLAFNTDTVEETPYGNEYNQMHALITQWKLKILNDIKKIEF